MKEEKKYNGWLVSNNIFKRSLAIYGHLLVGYFIILLLLFILGVLFSLIMYLF